jgi:glycine hydroxymethyltransferase
VPFSDFVTFTTYKTLGGGRGGVILCRKEHAARLDRSIFPGGQGTPAINGVAAKALCLRLAMTEKFRALQEKTLENAAAFAEAFSGYGYRLVSGGTENHMVLLDLRSKRIRGNQAEKALETVGIVTNRNVIPFDPEPAGVASGIRIGSPAITARGMGPAEVIRIAELIDRTLRHRNESGMLVSVSSQVRLLCRSFPVYRDR